MNDLQRVDLQDPAIKSRRSPVRTGRKVAICLLVTLIVAVMIAWFCFLGWGAVEILQWLSACIRNFWTTYFSLDPCCCPGSIVDWLILDQNRTKWERTCVPGI